MFSFLLSLFFEESNLIIGAIAELLDYIAPLAVMFLIWIFREEEPKRYREAQRRERDWT